MDNDFYWSRPEGVLARMWQFRWVEQVRPKKKKRKRERKKGNATVLHYRWRFPIEKRLHTASLLWYLREKLHDSIAINRNQYCFDWDLIPTLVESYTFRKSHLNLQNIYHHFLDSWDLSIDSYAFPIWAVR